MRTVPAWMGSDVQPLAVTDALEVLARCLEVEPRTRSYDVGGERLSYRALLDPYAEVAGLSQGGHRACARATGPSRPH